MTTRSRAFAAVFVLAGVCIIWPHSIHARDTARPTLQQRVPLDPVFDRSDALAPGERRVAHASPDTLVLGSWSFNGSGTCTTEGWTVHDLTTDPVVMTHVDDFAGLNGGSFGRLHPIVGNRSMWCGLRPNPSDPVVCGYATLPGYPNSMDQTLTVKSCLNVTGAVTFDYWLTWDLEPGYDFVGIEIDHCDDNWTRFPPGSAGCGYYGGGVCSGFTWSGEDSLVSLVIQPADHLGQFRVRIRATSDGAWSDEDGMWDTDGAYVTDDLLITDQNGVVVPLEDFESAPIGATEVANWVAERPNAYGSYAAVIPGLSTLQQGNCSQDISCLWAFYVGSTYNYACGGFPARAAIPFGNALGQYLNNEVWSPWMPNVGTGNEYLYEFDVMKDLPLDNLIFFVWHIRSLVDGCPNGWRDFGFFYYGTERDWLRQRFAVGTLVEPNATQLQLAFGVVDLCGVWCGQVGSGACHSNGPLFDNPRLLRVDLNGPRFSVNEIDQFQDSFADDGTLTGTVRADIARDLNPVLVGHVIPGDSSVVGVQDVDVGLGTDPTVGSAAVYMYVSVWPQGQPGKSGTGLQAPETRQGGLRYPVVGSWTDASGVEWTCIRADSAGLGGGYYTPLDRFVFDMRDDLFTPGDSICFFYAARNAIGEETYAFGPSVQDFGNDREQAATNPAEFTCLPAGGYNRGGSILYVDGADGRGSQPYWDAAFDAVGLRDKIDRYDVRSPSSQQSNRPAGRVADVLTQLVGVYRTILWDCGSLSGTLGNGDSSIKTNDYALLNTFLGNLPTMGGVMLMGDDVPSGVAGGGGSAATFHNTYVPFSLSAGNHASAGYGISPLIQFVNGGCYDDGFVLAGACPVARDFDVMEPTGASSLEMTYGIPNVTNGGVVGKTTDNGSAMVNVLLAGFGFDAIRDDDLDGVSDRARFLANSLAWLGSGSVQATPAGSPVVNSLSQNYPNPFNPQTTIMFSLRQRGTVQLAVYNVAGQLVRTLVNGDHAAGAHTLDWDGTNNAGSPVSSGVYFYKLVAKDFSQTRKMVLLK